MPELLRLASFTTDPSGGNPAGVWLGDAFLPDDEMLAIAADVGYSETAFVIPAPAGDHDPLSRRVRYFSQVEEVAFCGHATIATAVALAEREGCDLIAMSTHGHRFLGDVLHGATADRVRHLVKVPVLLLRKQESAGSD